MKMKVIDQSEGNMLLYWSAHLVILFVFLSHSFGRQEGHPACKKLSGEVLALLSVWSRVQTCIWPS